MNLPTDEKLKVADMGCGSGGQTIQRFLKEDLIDELILTTIPILLGGRIPLFFELPQPMEFERVESKGYLDKVAQNRSIRKR